MRWSSTLNPSWNAMMETTALDDGNLVTGVSSSDSGSVGASANCQTLLLSAPLTVESRYTTEHALTSWRARGVLELALLQTQSFCASHPDIDPPATGGSAILALQGWIGGEWVEIDSYTLTVPTLVYATSQGLAFDTEAQAIETTSCRVRCVLTYGYTWTGSNNTISILGDLRELDLVSTDTETPCEDSGSGGGGGGGGETPGGGACPCDSARRAVACSGSQRPQVTCTRSSRKACG